MSTIQYEELDDFFKQMKDLNKNKTVYMTVVRTKKEQSMAGAVRVMFKDEDGILHQYNHSEDIQELRLINAGLFDMFLTEDQSKKAKDDYMLTVKLFEESLKKESEKMKKVLLDRFGVTQIYNAYSI